MKKLDNECVQIRTDIQQTLEEMMQRIEDLKKTLMRRRDSIGFTETELRDVTSQLHDKMALIQSLRNLLQDKSYLDLDHMLSAVEDCLNGTLDLAPKIPRNQINIH